ncbi:hypothetical protein [Oceanobacillus jordanicus]|uniref:Uncharacterized protein n=1 Tax=Oceanobacillus jordanicus TaxID=2867266 RepID=A0AAW5BD68_9BACI|nr:hypothetical protein [Oceanobacillus jordanicus]MCG3420664.1 hypothetical protein [Oceanobacillus jordanicus]
MNSTVKLPGIEGFTVQHTEEIDGVYRLFVLKEIVRAACIALSPICSSTSLDSR